MAARIARSFLLGWLALILGTQAGLANWVASGSFRYQDREFDQNGFTGNQPTLPIRHATVEIRDLNVNGGQQLLSTGATDAAGNFSITIVDSSTKTRNIVARALTRSTAVPGLYVSLTTVFGPASYYAVTSAGFSHSNPNLNLNLGTTTALVGSGGEPFNLYDVALNSLNYLAFLNGSWPDSSRALTLKWEPFSGNAATSFQPGGIIQVGDPSAYNDTVIQHESGHFAREAYSDTDSPGGIHHLTNCSQDLRLAWEEGWATYFGQAVRRHFNLPRPHLYVKTTGQPGAGNLDFYFDVEDESPYSCNGAASEVSVYATLWDITDSAATQDATPGVDEPQDPLGAPDGSVWDVMKNFIRTATNRTFEDFWDGWFIRGQGSYSEMRQIFAGQVIEYFEDVSEPNDVVPAATAAPSNGIPIHATYFRNQGNGAGTVDLDYFWFAGQAGVSYVIQTRNLLSDANTSLVLYRSDGVTVLASNDDQSPLNKASLINFVAPTTSTYYVKSIHGSGYGAYGSYDFSVTSSVLSTAGSEPPPTQIPEIRTRPQIVDGNP